MLDKWGSYLLKYIIVNVTAVCGQRERLIVQGSPSLAADY